MQQPTVGATSSRCDVLNVISLPTSQLHLDCLRLRKVLPAKGGVAFVDRTFVGGYLSHACLATTLYLVCFFKAEVIDF